MLAPSMRVIPSAILRCCACSIAVLKMLRKNKGFYYKLKNFTTVSGMMYRMKQNAVGLANICILSTMLLVTVSTTVSLYIGAEDSLRNEFPRDIIVHCSAIEEEDFDGICEVFLEDNLTEQFFYKEDGKWIEVLK